MNYKAPDNSLHFIEPEFAHLLPAGSVPITDQEADAIRSAAIAALPVVIPNLTPRQVRLALTAAGLRDQVEAAVLAADQNTKDTWEFATEIVRTDPILIAMAKSIGITNAKLDKLFLDGSKL
jgi:hypothetical protein